MKKTEFDKIDARNLTEEAKKIYETLDLPKEDIEGFFQGVNADDYRTISAILVDMFGEE